MIALGRSRNELDAVVGPAASASRLTVLPRGWPGSSEERFTKVLARRRRPLDVDARPAL